MYLTQININPDLNSARRALSSPQIMHAIIEKCFEESQRNLWSLDDNKLLIVSTAQPTNREAAEQLGGLPQTKSYAPYLESIADGDIYRFRLRANPVHSVKVKQGERGKVLAHVTIEQQENWLRIKAENLGFELGEFAVTSSEFVQFNKAGGQRVTLKLATYDGFLTVTNRDALTAAMTDGIGRAKAYGAGLLTMMRV
jgi:CRISPR-associated protein Cas6/Cse3/CasE, subtype I-E/ECOLI